MAFALILLLSFVASTLGTITSFGTSTIMMPVLMMFYPLDQSLFFVTIIHFFNALMRVLYFRRGFDLRLILSFGIAGIISAFYGAKVFYTIDKNLLTKGIAAFLFIYAIFLWKHPEFKIKFSNTIGILGGAASGFIAGICGMGGAIRGALLAAFNLPKEVYLANSALLLLFIDSSRLLSYFREGASIKHLLDLDKIFICAEIGIGLCILVSFLGVALGKRIIEHIPQDKFRLFIAVFLLLISVKLLIS